MCEALGIEWTDAMLHWPAGPHPQDGVWAPHWYGRVERSTGFEGEEQAAAAKLDDGLQAVADACHGDYAAMAVHRLRSKE